MKEAETSSTAYDAGKLVISGGNMVEVRLFATFREGRKKIYQMDASEVSAASDVLDILQIPYEEVAIYLINGRHSDLKAAVKDGDVLAIFPPVGGG